MSTVVPALCNRECLCATGYTSNEALQNCEAYPKVARCLTAYFHFGEFRPGQLETLMAVLHGRDVFVRLPTGGGKSLCMFLVPLTHDPDTVGVIISPLIGLMDEQVSKLSRIGVKAVRAVSSNKDAFSCALSGEYRFVLMSPETATTDPWRKLFRNGRIVMVAVDEAHCISERGERFRTAFKQLGGLRALTTAPFMALTASAPPSVEREVKESLELANCVMVTLPLDRPNIYISTKKKSSILRDFGGIASSMRDCSSPEDFPKTLVFCKTKAQCVNIYNLFIRVSTHKSIVTMYHATLSEETKEFIYHHFTAAESDLRCIVCTIAFGMGMDVPDVSRVLVYGLPDSISQYYQLIGRAGRAKQQSTSLLLFSDAEVKKCSDPSLRAFCEDGENCRRHTLLQALSKNGRSTVPPNMCCNVCEAVCPYTQLVCPASTLEVKKCRKRVRSLSAEAQSSLQSMLVAERDRLINDNPALKMVPKSVVCPISVIKEVAARSASINCLEDIRTFPGVREQLQVTFFNVVECVCPSYKRVRLA